MQLEELTLGDWADAFPADGFEVFHTPEAVRVLDDHATGELRLFGGFKGHEPVALLPILVKEKFGVRAALSPPPEFGIRRLGPIVMPTSTKTSKREKVNRVFVEKVVDALDVHDSFSFAHLMCSPEYADPRPFSWNGFGVEPAFTYRLALDSTSPDEILKSFSKSLRREVRDGENIDVSIRLQGERGARKIYRATRERFREQGKGFALSWEFVRDLLRALDERARVYVAESADGEFLSGIVVLYSNETAYFWKGGARRSYRGVSVNTLLHWRIIRDVLTDPALDEIDRYDLYTANNDRISRYKSKFGGELVPYYKVQTGGLPMAVLKSAYRAITYGENPVRRRLLDRG